MYDDQIHHDLARAKNGTLHPALFTRTKSAPGLSSNNTQSSLTPRLSVYPAKGGIQQNAPKLDFKRASSGEKSSRALERAASTSTAVGSAALHPQTTLQNDKQRLPTLVVAANKKQGGREGAPEPSSFFQRVSSVPVTDTEKQKASPKWIPSGVYTGDELKPGVPHGTGLLVTKSGHRFEGSWENGEMHGRGSCQSPSGRNYTGQWTKGKITGKGTQVYADGLIESGWFQNGKLSGYGERLQPDKVRYEGFFIHGLEEGQGKATYPSGNYFEGLWSSGLPLAGEGRMTSKNTGGISAGSWEYYGAVKADNTGDLEFHGQGKHWWKCGGGGGKIVWSYVGGFERGKKNGQGHKTHHIEGWSYEGEWLLDHMTGRGKLLCPRQEGALRGDIYEGEFCDGVPHGYCKYLRSDGQYQYGEWKDGEFVSGDACLKFPHGASYNGKCVGSSVHGLGTMTFSDGNTITGVFENDCVPELAHLQVSNWIDSRPVSYEATFRGFLGTKLGLSVKNGKLPKPRRLHAVEGSDLQDLKATLTARTSNGDAGFDSLRRTTSSPGRTRPQVRVTPANFITSLFFPAPKPITFKDIVNPSRIPSV